LVLFALPLLTALSQPRIEMAYQPESTVSPEIATLTAIYATVTAQAQGQFLPTPTPFNPEATPEPPTPTPSLTPTPVISPDARILLDVRADLELLADQQLGIAQRPEGWSGSTDFTNPQLGLLVRLDLELLYGGLVDAANRPSGWFGAVGSTPLAIARDTRHDLELMADLFFGPATRPDGWRSADPLFRCNRSTQTLIALLQRGGLFVLEVPANDPNFCYNAEVAATRFVETRILASALDAGLFNPSLTVLSEYQIDGEVAVAFLDPSAQIKVGVIPRGTPIQVIARSYAQFSNMTLVSGPDFQVYVEYQNTTLTDEQFRGLPNLTTVSPAPTCLADWCEGS
jgi:hypothetical protein